MRLSNHFGKLVTIKQFISKIPLLRNTFIHLFPLYNQILYQIDIYKFFI